MTKQFYKGYKKGITVITLTYLLTVILMLPFRQLSFQDDFAYYHSVRNLLNLGLLKLSEWSSATLILQVYWGALFAKIFGLSFKSLHLSVVILLFFGVISFYLMMRRLEFSNIKAIVFSLFLLAYPSIIRFSYSFMTDIPYLSLELLSLFVSVVAIKTNKSKYYFLASLLGMMAFLIRQFGAMIPLALILTLIVQSFLKKKVLLKQLVAVLLPFTFILGGYISWLNVPGNKTQAYYLVVESNFRYLMMYWIPKGLHRLRPTSDIYNEVVYRGSFYLYLLMVLLTPLLLMFSLPRLKTLRASLARNRSSLFIGIFIMLILYINLVSRAKNLEVLSLNIFQAPKMLLEIPGKYAAPLSKIWNLATLVSFPFWCLIWGILTRRFHGLFFERRLRRHYLFFGFSVLLLVAYLVYYLALGISKFGPDFISGAYFLFFLFSTLILASIQTFFYRLKRKVSDIRASSLVLFFFSFGLLQMIMTIFGFFMWEEYIISFVPLLILAVATVLKRERLVGVRSILVLAVMFFLSLYFAKLDYDSVGIQWEEAEGVVKQGLVDPREVGITAWGWIPYFLHEESFEKRLKEVAGEKKLITQVHTWWEDPEYKFRPERLFFIPGECEGVQNSDGQKIIKKIRAKSLFSDFRYCVILRSTGI